MRKIALLICLVYAGMQVKSQTSGIAKPKKISVDASVTSNLLQFALSQNTGAFSQVNYIPRYTYFFNTGYYFNYKASKHLLPFLGISVKNIGVIEKQDSIKTKRRNYIAGVPVGIKIAFSKKFEWRIGADLNLSINYKEKRFVNDVKQSKFNEFFSDRTPLFYPAIFTGFNLYSFNVDIHYYPTNFLQPNYEPTAGYKPYTGYNTQILAIGLGIDIGDEYYKTKKFKKNPSK